MCKRRLSLIKQIHNNSFENNSKKVIIFALILCFPIVMILSEFCYRGYVYFQKPIYRPTSIPNLGWEPTPGAVKKNNVTYLINLSGFRDKTNGIWRQWKSNDLKIAFIGDSITYGGGVNYENTFCCIVESILSKTGFNTVRVVNFGMLGINSRQHWAILKYKVIPLKPDIVIIAYFLNDTERRKVEKLPISFQYILRYFHFGTFLSERIITFLENRKAQQIRNPPGNELGRENLYEGYTKKTIDTYDTMAWEDNKEIILSMKRLCNQEGIKYFAFVIFPFEDQIKGSCPATPQKKITQFLSDNAIPYLDMAKIYEIYSRINNEKLYLQEDNCHPNATGHYIAGKAISEWLLCVGFDTFESKRRVNHE